MLAGFEPILTRGRWVHALMHGSYPVDKVPENYVRRFYSDLFQKKDEE